MNAKEAREMSNNAFQNGFVDLLKQAHSVVESAARIGNHNTSVFICGRAELAALDRVKQELESEGFGVSIGRAGGTSLLIDW